MMGASITGNVSEINRLLDRGADINDKDIEGNTALMFASIYSNNTNNLEAIKLLLDRGADINAENNNGSTALMLASEYSNDSSSIDAVKLLLDNGAIINHKDNYGNTALMVASDSTNNTSSLETVELLLDRGADINEKNNNGLTALMLSSQNSNDTIEENTSSIETVELLLKRGADPFVECNDIDCDQVLAPYRWKRLYQRDMSTANRYSKTGDVKLPKDIWELILLNKRQQMLCQKLSSSKNQYVLAEFALEMNIPITDAMTKSQLCAMISRQLAYGKYYDENTKKKIKEDIRKLKEIAFRYGLDVNRPIGEISNDIASIFIEYKM